MCILDLIVFLCYSLMKATSYWEDSPNVGASILLALPFNFIVCKFIGSIIININFTVFILSYIVLIFLFYTLIKNRLPKALYRFRKNKICFARSIFYIENIKTK